MRAMKDSGVDWIGIVPEHWEMRRAKAMFRQSTSKGNDRLVLLSATQDRGVVDKSTLDSVVQVSEDADLSTFKTVHKNDFVISLRSFQGGFEISHEEGVISPVYTVFRLSKQTYPHFYRHLFKSYGFIDKINSLTVGIREGKNIQYVDFADMLLPYIPLAEQQRIAEFLDRKCAEVDEMIALQEQIIEELKAYKQSVITEAVTKGLNPDAPMKDSGIEWIGSIPEHWEVCKLKRKYRLLNGRAYSDNELLFEGRYRILRVGNLFTSNHWYYSDLELEDNKYCEKGDLLYGWSASIGPYMWEEEKVIYHYHIWKVLFAPNSRRYVYYQLQALTDAKKKDMHGTAMQHLTMDNMNNSYIATAPLSEQQAIADYLDEKCVDIDALIATKQQKIDSLKEYKKSIIYEYVTGKKEIA